MINMIILTLALSTPDSTLSIEQIDQHIQRLRLKHSELSENLLRYEGAIKTLEFLRLKLITDTTAVDTLNGRKP